NLEAATDVAEVVVAGDSTRAARAVGAGDRAGDLRVAGGAAGRAGQVGRPLAVDKADVARRDGGHRVPVDAVGRAGCDHGKARRNHAQVAVDIVDGVVGSAQAGAVADRVDAADGTARDGAGGTAQAAAHNQCVLSVDKAGVGGRVARAAT